VGRRALSFAAAALLLAGCGGQTSSHAKQPGTVYILNHDVIVDLAGGGYASITLGLEVEAGTDTAEEQTPIVREVVSNDLTGIRRDDLLIAERRDAVKAKLARDIRRRTDIQLDRVLLVDFTLH
jgi:hypothetical protein